MEASVEQPFQDPVETTDEQFRRIADSLPGLIWIAATDKLCTWFNQGWLEFVGRTMEQEIGNGWAENVHADDFARCVETYVTSFDARRAFRMEYRLRHNDGSYHWVLDEGRPLYDGSGEFTGYVGSCLDVTDQKRIEEELATRAEEQLATQKRLELLVRAGELFHRSLNLDETLGNVARMAVEAFADLCLFDLLDESTHSLYVSVGAHRDPEVEASLKALVTPLLQSETRRTHPARQVAETGGSFFVPVLDEATLVQHASSKEHEAFMRQLRYRSKIVVPVLAQGAIFGALTFVRTEESEPFDAEDLTAAEELGRRAGAAVANAKQYTREQHVAEVLQQAFLNQELPEAETVHLSAMYQAAQDESSLGGDWYDAFKIGDALVMTVGDVTGKGIDAARLMVQLRQWIRMTAEMTADPARILELVNVALLREAKADLATALVAVVDEAKGMLTFASAGHPPPFLKRSDGRAALLPVKAGIPLGIDRTTFVSETIDIRDASLLVLYTDGLTEMQKDVVRGEAAVERLVASDEILFAANPARYMIHIAADRKPRDDVAVLTARFGRTVPRWTLDVADSSAAYAVKRDFLAAVASLSEGTADIDACSVIFGELVGNVVRHAPGRVSLGLSTEGRTLWFHAMDEGPGFDASPQLPSDIWSEGGRGLYMVQALAADFIVRRLPGYGTYAKVLLPKRQRRTTP